jgi:hypothetical protein
LVFYYQQILKPLSLQKQKDEERMKKRKDFHTIFSLKGDYKAFVYKYFDKSKDLDEDDKIYKNEHSKIPWLINQFEKKFWNYQIVSLQVINKTEIEMKKLHEMLITIIMKYNYNHSKDVYALIRRVQDKLFSFQEQIDIKVLNRKSYKIA